VLIGSTVGTEGLKSWISFKSLRDQLLQEKALTDSSDSNPLVFTADIAFSSPSAAAAVVNAGNINGRTAWKAPTGQTYASCHESKIANASGGEGREGSH
jgi:hypothetical protein